METTIKRKLTTPQMQIMFESGLVNIRHYESINKVTDLDKPEYFKIRIRHSEDEKAFAIFKAAKSIVCKKRYLSPDFRAFINKDSHYFSESHLRGWFAGEYLGKLKSEIRYKLEETHDNSEEIENAENELNRNLTEWEKTKLVKMFNLCFHSA